MKIYARIGQLKLHMYGCMKIYARIGQLKLHMYGCVLVNGTDVHVTDKLRIYARNGAQSKIIHHTVTEDEVSEGRLFMNITLIKPPSTPFIVWGAVFYDTGEPCAEKCDCHEQEHRKHMER